MQSLFIIAIGPVQEFIATARRSRDLWFGSWLLSELSKAAAHCIVIEQKNDLGCLVFPKPDTIDDLNGVNQDFNVVNKIVALITEEPQTMGKRVGESMLAHLQTIREDAFARISERNFYGDIARAQVDDLIEWYWAAVPVSDPQDPTIYQAVRRQAEALLAARKNTREFIQPVRWASNAPKSSLDGLRESVIPESVYNELSEKQLFSRYGIRRGERLCGVGLLKRHGNRANATGFLSTSHVAALPLLNQLTTAALPQVQQYVERLRTLNIAEEALQPMTGWTHPVFTTDGHLLFEERLAEFFDKDEKGNLQKAKEALAKFLSVAANGQRPLPYYALLHADGDHMGKAIDAQQTVERHRTLSSKLTAFAKKVPKLVEGHQGSLVYAGGDDVLAFLPLHTVVSCARALADEFKTIMKEFTTGEGSNQDQPVTPTLSVGVVITHHIEPLSDALQLVRAAEKAAKRIEGKNALAITLSKRSGIDRTVVGKWGTIDMRLDKFVCLHRMEAVPDGAAYELQDLARRLAHHVEAMRVEAMRILIRKRAERGNKAMADQVLTELSSLIQQTDLPMIQLADELIIARLLAQATNQAGIKLEELCGVLDLVAAKE